MIAWISKYGCAAVLVVILLIPFCLILAVLLVRLNDFLKGLN